MEDGSGKYFAVELVKLTTFSSYNIAKAKQHFGFFHIIHMIMVF